MFLLFRCFCYSDVQYSAPHRISVLSLSRFLVGKEPIKDQDGRLLTCANLATPCLDFVGLAQLGFFLIFLQAYELDSAVGYQMGLKKSEQVNKTIPSKKPSKNFQAHPSTKKVLRIF